MFPFHVVTLCTFVEISGTMILNTLHDVQLFDIRIHTYVILVTFVTLLKNTHYFFYTKNS